MKAVADAGSDIIDHVGKVRGAIRRRNFAKRAEASTLAAIEDPAVAAGVLFFAMAAEKDAGTLKCKPLIVEKLSTIISAEDAEDVAVFCEWAAQSVTDPKDVVRRYTKLWFERLSPAERAELLQIADEIAQIDGPCDRFAGKCAANTQTVTDPLRIVS